jgi:hypothetical protein
MSEPETKICRRPRPVPPAELCNVLYYKYPDLAWGAG